MQYKNPIDIELIQASQEAYEVMMHICEYMGMSPDAAIPLRLRLAIGNARQEMQLQEEDERQDFVAPLAPPGSMD